MTEQKILYSIKKFELCKGRGYNLEAVLRVYHLNIKMLKFLSVRLLAVEHNDDVKPKHIVNQLVEQLNLNTSLKTTINKKNLKTLKPWLTKMDTFMKTLKHREPSNTKTLLAESEQILGILKISVTKILIVDKK